MGAAKTQGFLKVESQFLKAVTWQLGDDSGISVTSKAPGGCCPTERSALTGASSTCAVLMGPSQANSQGFASRTAFSGTCAGSIIPNSEEGRRLP